MHPCECGQANTHLLKVDALIHPASKLVRTLLDAVLDDGERDVLDSPVCVCMYEYVCICMKMCAHSHICSIFDAQRW